MTEKQRVYIVIDDDDEYGKDVVGVFSSRENAREFIDHDEGVGLSIEEYTVDEVSPCMGKRPWTVSTRIEGMKAVEDMPNYTWAGGYGTEDVCVQYIRDIYGHEHLMCQVMATGIAEAKAAAAEVCEEVLHNESTKYPYLRREIIARGDVDDREMVMYEERTCCPLYSVKTGEILLRRGEGFRRLFYEGDNFNRYEKSLHLPDGVKWRRIDYY